MKTNEAILKRIKEICEEKGNNICKACLNGGKSPSALYDLMKGRTKCPKVTTIKSFWQISRHYPNMMKILIPSSLL